MKKLSYDKIKQDFLNQQYILNTKEDEFITKKMNSSSYFYITCPKKHFIFIKYNKFQQGRRCPVCYNLYKRGKSKKISYEETIRRLNEKNFKTSITKEEYKKLNSTSKIPVICINNHKTKMIINNINRGYKCKKCSLIEKSGFKSYNWNEYQEYLKQYKKVKTKMKNMLRKILTSNNKTKISKTEEYIGYTTADLINHLNTFNNFESIKENYELDHIFPLKVFFDYNIYDPKIINSLDNLQPLTKKDNIKKSNKYDKIAFFNYLKKHGINIEKMVD